MPETHPDYVALITSIVTFLTIVIKWVAENRGNRKREEVVKQQHQEILGEVRKNTEVTLTAAAAAVESTGMPLEEITGSENARYLKEQFDKYRGERHLKEAEDANKKQKTKEGRRRTREEQNN